MPRSKTKAGSRQHMNEILAFITDVQEAFGSDATNALIGSQQMHGVADGQWSLPVLLGQINRRDLSIRFRQLKAKDEHFLQKSRARNSLFNVEFIKVLLNWLKLCEQKHANPDALLAEIQSIQTAAAALPSEPSSEEEHSDTASSTSTASTENSAESGSDAPESMDSEGTHSDGDTPFGEPFTVSFFSPPRSPAPHWSPVSLSPAGSPTPLSHVTASTSWREELTAVLPVDSTTSELPDALGLPAPSTHVTTLPAVSSTVSEPVPQIRLGNYTGPRARLGVLSANGGGAAVALLARIQAHIRTVRWDTGCFGGEQVGFASTPAVTKKVPRHVAQQLDVMQAFVRDSAGQDAATREHLALQALVKVLFVIPAEAREKYGFCDLRRLNRFLFRSAETGFYYRACMKAEATLLARQFGVAVNGDVGQLLNLLVLRRDALRGDMPASMNALDAVYDEVLRARPSDAGLHYV